MKNQQISDFKEILQNVYNKGNNGASMQEVMRLLELELLRMSDISVSEKKTRGQSAPRSKK
ncbi:hypothetical protein [Niallia hominis]|uniref:IS256 family transposase n=1 Tax=Niallia hominis TaxID=3133173 RepID=A0ABV1EUD0_9BACI